MLKKRLVLVFTALAMLATVTATRWSLSVRATETEESTASELQEEHAEHFACTCALGDRCDVAHEDKLIWEAWGDGEGESTALPASGCYYLTRDIVLPESYTYTVIPAAKTLYLCLNGYSIDLTATQSRAYLNQGTLVLMDCKQQGAIFGGNCTWGGAVNCAGKVNTFIGVTFKKNTSTGNGGVLRTGADNSSLTVAYCSFLNNTALSGGAIYIDKNATVNIVNSIFEGNASTGNGGVNGGGAIFKASTTGLTVRNSSFTGNTAANNNVENKYGGGAMILGAGTTVLYDCVFRGNTARELGGAICARLSSVTLNLYDCRLTENSAHQGGGIFSAGAVINIVGTGTDKSVLDGNSGLLTQYSETSYSNGHGGAIHAIDKSRITVQKTAITNNCCLYRKDDQTQVLNGFGGGIYIQSATASLAMEDCVLSGNGATYGGALRMIASTALLTRCTFTGNTAGSVSGSALDLNNAGSACPATVTLRDCTVTDNLAEDPQVAAVFVSSGEAKLTAVGGTAVWNNAGDRNILLNNTQEAPDGVKLYIGDGTGMLFVQTAVLKDSNGANLINDPDMFLAKAEGSTYTTITGDPLRVYYMNMLRSVAYTEKDGFCFDAGSSQAHTHCLCGDGQGDHGCDGHAEIAWSVWPFTNSLPTEPGCYYLTNDVTVKTGAAITSGAQVRLCLNGKTVKVASGDTNTYFYQLTRGAKLSISDCTAHTQTVSGVSRYVSGKITGSKNAAIYLWNSGSDNRAYLDLYDGQITGNSRNNMGGAIATQPDATGEKIINIYGGEITGNASIGERGGAVCLRSGVTLNMYGGRISGNTADQNGGGICTYDGGTVNLYGGVISGNSALGSVGNTGFGGGVCINTESSTLVLAGAVIKDNVAAGRGGGISANQGTVIFQSGEVSGNSASLAGGGIYMDGGSIRLQNGTVANNLLKNGGVGGGGVYVIRGHMDMEGGEISQNISYSCGGGLLINDSDFTVTGGKISANRSMYGAGLCMWNASSAILDGGEISDNTAEIHGGGVYANAGSTFKLCKGTVVRNTARDGNGGAVFAEQSGKRPASITVSGGTVSTNRAGKQGGAIYLNNSNLTVTGGTVCYNTSGYNGGAVCTGGTCAVKMSGGSIVGNAANGHGGGLLIQGNGSTLQLTGGSILKNTGNHGGGIYCSKQTEFYMSGGTIRNNTARNGYSGGGLYISTAKLTLAGGSIQENTANVSGGGIFSFGANVRMNGTEIIGNTARSGGGAEITNHSVFVMESGRISNNSATQRGGGIVAQSALTINGGEISGNSVLPNESYPETYGGGVCIAGGEPSRILTINGGEIFGNTAAYGGGVQVGNLSTYRYNAELIMTGGVIRDNTATIRGGGVNSTFKTDVSSVVARMYITGAEIYNNTAPTGGGIYVDKNYDMRLVDSVVRNNEATQADGGGVYISMGTQAALIGSSITDNTAIGTAGGVYAVDDLVMSDVTVTGNTSGKLGALYLDREKYDGHSYMIGTAKMSGNMIVRDNPGGDMYLGEGKIVTIDTEGLGRDTYIHLRLSSGLLTDTVFGTYGYEGGQLDYVIQKGDRSVTNPERIPETKPTETEPTDPAQPTETDGHTGTTALIIGCAVAVTLMGCVAAVIFRRKKH